jgi:uncharacterized protein (TIGR02271 family)
MTARKRDSAVTRDHDTGTGGTEPWEGRSTIVGLFPDRSHAEAAINDLKAEGFSEDEIGIAMRDRTAQGQLIEDTGAQATEGAAKGAVGGGVIGGVVGLLGGLGALAIPGLGPIFAAGWLGSTLAGAGIGAAAGGILGALVGAGVPEHEAKHFERGFKEGGILVTVRAGERAAAAVDVLRRRGADLGPTIGAASTAASDTSSFSDTRAGSQDITEEREGRIQLREEEVDIRKERVEAGEVRLRKEVITEQRQIDVPVTREEVVVERRPVSGAEAEAGEIAEEGEEIRVPLTEERVRVEKRPVVKEEVSIGKQKIQDTQHVSESVRHEEARLENQGVSDVRMRGERNRYSGTERRRRHDPSYGGRERRASV